ncbi:MAG: EAL domain-containing protein [Magnetovibrio sp.]|nr:EAL domain-containing protein [Magnetovibrio sp.]
MIGKTKHGKKDQLKPSSPKVGEPKVDEDVGLRGEHSILSTLSHEMRTPLNNIIGFADMMSSEILGPMGQPQYRDYAEDIRRSGQSILDLMNELLENRRFEVVAKGDAHHASMIDLAPDLITICSDDGKILQLNPAGCAMLGVDASEAQGRPLKDFMHADHYAFLEDGFALMLAEERRTSMKLIPYEGREVEVEMAAILYEEKSKKKPYRQIMLIARDVTERNRSMNEVSEREEFLQSIMATTVDGLITINEVGVIETSNPAAERIFGFLPGAMNGSSFAALIPDAHGRRQSNTANVLKKMQTSKTKKNAILEMIGLRNNGDKFPLEVSLSDFSLRNRTHHIAVMRDITERKRDEDKLKFLATHDPLTHLPNRYTFNQRLEESARSADDTGHRMAVLFIDLDNFKHINDAMGHPIGDVVLQLVGKRLETCVRSRDLVARLTGDEFTVILESVKGDIEVQNVADHMLHQLRQPFHVDGKELYTSGSIGIVVYPDNCDKVKDILKNAYTSSHHAKQQGRNNYQFYSSTLSANVLRRMALEQGLRHALENNEFYLAYQAKVDLGTGKIIGAEALARWTNPELGPVSPVEFVPVAEETGLIVPIGDWILETAMRQAAEWIENGLPDITVSINLSVRQFQQGNLVERIAELMEKTGLPAKNLDLELTESVLVENADETIKLLGRLKGLGASLSIDDFGTGYSSLSYLTKFPLDALKVDRSFVTGLPDDSDAVTMAKAIVNMARNLGLKVIAEGIENERQGTFLHGLGSDIGQGYLYSRPVSFEAFVRLAGGNVTQFPVDNILSIKPSA